jgi:putative FmdB family regulatory protein
VRLVPIYEYECPDCGRFENMNSYENMLKTCPTCGKEVKRLYSPVGVLYKTIGFYTTDVNGRLHLPDKSGKLGS